MKRNDGLALGALITLVSLLFLGVSIYEVQFYSSELDVSIVSLIGSLVGTAIIAYSLTVAKSGVKGNLDVSSLVRYYLIATIASVIAAVSFTVPVLVPEFIFPLKLTIWPGTWMFISYFTFLIVGVLGGLGWALFWDLLKRHFGIVETNRYLMIASFSLTYFAVYGETALMFAVGYEGGSAALIGFGREVITQGIIGWMVVPIGIFILLYLIGTLMAIASTVLSLTSRSPQLKLAN